MKHINTGLLAAAIALGAASVFGATPVEARPAIVERLADINTRATTKDHGGLAYNSRLVTDKDSNSGGILVASGDTFGGADAGTASRPTIVQRLAEINLAGTDRNHGGLSYNSRTLR